MRLVKGLAARTGRDVEQMSENQITDWLQRRSDNNMCLPSHRHVLVALGHQLVSILFNLPLVPYLCDWGAHYKLFLNT